MLDLIEESVVSLHQHALTQLSNNLTPDAERVQLSLQIKHLQHNGSLNVNVFSIYYTE